MADFIWHPLTGENRVEAIARIVAEEFDVDPEQAGAGVCEFLTALQALKLVVYRDREEACNKLW